MTPGYEANISVVANGGQSDNCAVWRWQEAIEAGRTLSLLMIEVDDLRRYEDCYGPEAGDVLLRQVARAVDRCCGPLPAPAGRVWGGEFVLLVPGLEAVRARAAAERVLTGVRDLEIPHRGSTVSNYVTVSIGVASCRPRAGDSAAAVVDAAAGALWAAKRRGGDRAEIRDLDALARESFDTLRRLRA